MNSAIILHGKPAKERYLDPTQPKPHEANWFPWIGKRLLERDIKITIPALPRPYFPVYEAWRNVFEEEKIDISTGLVGHSAGAEFILRWLSTNKDVSVERVVLVAPYRDYAGKYDDFSMYALDTGLQDRVGKLIIMHSLDDDKPIQKRANELSQILPSAHLIELNGYGHFRIGHNMTSPDFPELLEELT